MEHFVSASCKGEKCGMCYREGMDTAATHKVGEEIPHDFPAKFVGHNLTQYVCCYHFGVIFRQASVQSWRGCPKSTI